MDTMEIPTDYQEEFLNEVHANEEERLVRFIRIFSELTNKIRYAPQKRVLVEVAFLSFVSHRQRKTGKLCLTGFHVWKKRWRMV